MGMTRGVERVGEGDFVIVVVADILLSRELDLVEASLEDEAEEAAVDDGFSSFCLECVGGIVFWDREKRKDLGVIIFPGGWIGPKERR
jgi:hypothetical protein